MKLLAALFFITMCLTASAKERFECEFFGPNYFLSFEDNGNITLSNSIKTYYCKKGFSNFPGTEVELPMLNCSYGVDKIAYYINENADGDFVLNAGLVLSRDIICKRQ